MARKKEKTPYEKLQIARNKDRFSITDYIEALFEDFIELCGDRLFMEDGSVLGGIAMFHDIPVTVIGHRKGRNTEENIRYNFGMPSPEGYRKALRLMQQAEKFHRPVITFIDTPGAYPGMEAEMHGQANAIAACIAGMSSLKTPILSVVTGEGNSGGALAIGVADRIFMMENAVYSILSPEGFASILWKDAKRAPEACDIMRLTAQDLKEFGMVEEIIPEGKHMISRLDKVLLRELQKLMTLKDSALVAGRYRKYRNIDGVHAPERGTK